MRRRPRTTIDLLCKFIAVVLLPASLPLTDCLASEILIFRFLSRLESVRRRRRTAVRPIGRD
jgi:hypothetical protein